MEANGGAQDLSVSAGADTITLSDVPSDNRPLTSSQFVHAAGYINISPSGIDDVMAACIQQGILAPVKQAGVQEPVSMEVDNVAPESHQTSDRVTSAITETDSHARPAAAAPAASAQQTGSQAAARFDQAAALEALWGHGCTQPRACTPPARPRVASNMPNSTPLAASGVVPAAAAAAAAEAYPAFNTTRQEEDIMQEPPVLPPSSAMSGVSARANKRRLEAEVGSEKHQRLKDHCSAAADAQQQLLATRGSTVEEFVEAMMAAVSAGRVLVVQGYLQSMDDEILQECLPKAISVAAAVGPDGVLGDLLPANNAMARPAAAVTPAAAFKRVVRERLLVVCPRRPPGLQTQGSQVVARNIELQALEISQQSKAATQQHTQTKDRLYRGRLEAEREWREVQMARNLFDQQVFTPLKPHAVMRENGDILNTSMVFEGGMLIAKVRRELNVGAEGSAFCKMYPGLTPQDMRINSCCDWWAQYDCPYESDGYLTKLLGCKCMVGQQLVYCCKPLITGYRSTPVGDDELLSACCRAQLAETEDTGNQIRCLNPACYKHPTWWRGMYEQLHLHVSSQMQTHPYYNSTQHWVLERLGMSLEMFGIAVDVGYLNTARCIFCMKDTPSTEIQEAAAEAAALAAASVATTTLDPLAAAAAVLADESCEVDAPTIGLKPCSTCPMACHATCYKAFTRDCQIPDEGTPEDNDFWQCISCRNAAACAAAGCEWCEDTAPHMIKEEYLAPQFEIWTAGCQQQTSSIASRNRK